MKGSLKIVGLEFTTRELSCPLINFETQEGLNQGEKLKLNLSEVVVLGSDFSPALLSVIVMCKYVITK